MSQCHCCWCGARVVFGYATLDKSKVSSGDETSDLQDTCCSSKCTHAVTTSKRLQSVQLLAEQFPKCVCNNIVCMTAWPTWGSNLWWWVPMAASILYRWGRCWIVLEQCWDDFFLPTTRMKINNTKSGVVWWMSSWFLKLYRGYVNDRMVPKAVDRALRKRVNQLHTWCTIFNMTVFWVLIVHVLLHCMFFRFLGKTCIDF